MLWVDSTVAPANTKYVRCCCRCTQEREYAAVHGVRNIDESLRRFLLRPYLLKAVGEVFESPVRVGGWGRAGGHVGRWTVVLASTALPC